MLTPYLGPDDVLIKLNATGLCMSDVHFMLNDWAQPPMSTFGTQCAGHEGAGVIVKVGENVKTLKVGQRAGYKPLQDVCHTCWECQNGRETYCLKAVLTGLHIDGIGSLDLNILCVELIVLEAHTSNISNLQRGTRVLSPMASATMWRGPSCALRPQSTRD